MTDNVSVKKIGIIGAGLSGIVAAKTCIEYGFEVKVFEKEIELGGVWASSRRYPGLATQKTKDTYHFTDFPMPKNFSEWPSGEEMQTYLTSYAKKFNVYPLIQFEYEVKEIDFVNNKWTVTGTKNNNASTEQFDFLIVCNGTFSDPFIPQIPGMDEFTSAGGEILHSTQFRDLNQCKDKNVVVVGYSKSSSDVATAASGVAKSTHLVFREAKWKIPRFIKGINAKYLLLNRLGEALTKPDKHNKVESFIHKRGMPGKMFSFMQGYITKQQGLEKLNLVPASGIKDQVFGETTMETPGFFDNLHAGKIIAKKGEITSFKDKQVVLSNNERLDCDTIIFATGFNQTIPFLPKRFIENFTDKNGNYILYRHILPAGIPSMAFVGYNSSFFSSMSSEFAALWVCEYLQGRVRKPGNEEIIKEGTEFIKWRSGFRQNGSSRSLSTAPGSLHHVDMLLRDMNASLSFFSLLPDWLVVTKPTRYKKLRANIVKRKSKQAIVK